MNGFNFLTVFLAILAVHCSNANAVFKRQTQRPFNSNTNSNFGYSSTMGYGSSNGPVQGLQPKQQQEWDAIINNDLQPLDDMKNTLKAFGKGLPDQQNDQVKDFIKRFEKLVKDRPDNLSNQAKDVYKQGKKIMDDDDLTVNQMKQQINQMLQNIDPNTRNELTQAMTQRMMSVAPEVQQYIYRM